MITTTTTTMCLTNSTPSNTTPFTYTSSEIDNGFKLYEEVKLLMPAYGFAFRNKLPLLRNGKLEVVKLPTGKEFHSAFIPNEGVYGRVPCEVSEYLPEGSNLRDCNYTMLNYCGGWTYYVFRCPNEGCQQFLRSY
jgi:hypothetical protein